MERSGVYGASLSCQENHLLTRSAVLLSFPNIPVWDTRAWNTLLIKLYIQCETVYTELWELGSVQDRV